jgi:hypothetical protein
VRTLFDVNVLIALFDPDHVHHDRAHAWWKRHRDEGWASCPLTENGFVRIISQPAYPSPVTTARAIELLVVATADTRHAFWSDDVSLADPKRIEPIHILGPKQLTDIYLLALATKQRGRLATFDRSIPVAAVPGAQTRHLAVI